MEQLYMLAYTPYSAGTHTLPQGYRFVRFTGSPKDISDWKRIIMEEPAPKDGADSCYHLMIEGNLEKSAHPSFISILCIFLTRLPKKRAQNVLFYPYSGANPPKIWKYSLKWA